MARNTTSYEILLTPGAGQGTTLRDGLNSNLNYWTVSSLFTFGSRDFFVLSQGNSEILVFCPNGLVGIASSIEVNYRFGEQEGDVNYALAFSYAPEGGFLASFAATNDPLNSSFWTHITTTQSKRNPSPFYRLYDFSNGQPQHRIYFIEDDTDPFLGIVGFRSAGLDTSFVSIYVFAEDLFDPSLQEIPARVHPEGFYYIKGNNAIASSNKTIRANGLYFQYWEETSGDRKQFIDPLTNSISLRDVVRSPHNDGSTQTLVYPLMNNQFQAFVNPLYLRIISRSLPQYKLKFGSDSNYKWIEIVRDFATPWDDNLANPT